MSKFCAIQYYVHYKNNKDKMAKYLRLAIHITKS